MGPHRLPHHRCSLLVHHLRQLSGGGHQNVWTYQQPFARQQRRLLQRRRQRRTITAATTLWTPSTTRAEDIPGLVPHDGMPPMENTVTAPPSYGRKVGYKN